MARASAPPTVFEWLLVESVAALIPTFVFAVAVLGGIAAIKLEQALHSAALLYIPCSIYLAVWGEMILEERSPGRKRILLGVVLFVFVIATMAYGMVLAHEGPGDAFRPVLWTAFQLIIAGAIMTHGAFEKSVSMDPRSGST